MKFLNEILWNRDTNTIVKFFTMFKICSTGKLETNVLIQSIGCTFRMDYELNEKCDVTRCQSNNRDQIGTHTCAETETFKMRFCFVGWKIVNYF